VSLLERLFNRDVYAHHPAARQNLTRKAQVDPYLPPFTNLVRVSQNLGGRRALIPELPVDSADPDGPGCPVL